ncbi:MAG: RCC1 domain-containing protein [Sporichthyaceae bacterium]
MARRTIRALVFAGAVAGLLAGGTPAAVATAQAPARPAISPAQCEAAEAIEGPTAQSAAAACGFTTVATGFFHACGITRDASMACWGWNNFGQLGSGTTAPSRIPVEVQGLGAKVASISLGGYHSCAVLVTGAATCWGMNGNGALGDGTLESKPLPLVPEGLGAGVTSLAAGYTHTCAVVSGAAKCWGLNYHGQLGDGSTTGSLTPIAVKGLSDVASLSAGEQHTCAVLTDGSAKCWGDNTHGQLGDGSYTDRLVPTAVDGLTDGAKSISAGMNHTCARVEVADHVGAKCWGRNASGQLGNGTATLKGLAKPVEVEGLPADQNVSSVEAGGGHSCASLADGSGWCWGFNESGQVGDGSWDGRVSPTPVRGLTAGVKQISAGAQFSCALVLGGQVSCWGSNRRGQLGNSGDQSLNEPGTVV